jgi:hypothetical protein
LSRKDFELGQWFKGFSSDEGQTLLPGENNLIPQPLLQSENGEKEKDINKLSPSVLGEGFREKPSKKVKH